MNSEIFEKKHRLKMELIHLKTLRCRYNSLGDYCQPEYCICDKMGKIERELEQLNKK